MAIQKALLSSKSDEWSTPQYFFDELNKDFSFTLDVCATDQNTKVPSRYFTKEHNGLEQNWNH